jgi:hypothetical protein
MDPKSALRLLFALALVLLCCPFVATEAASASRAIAGPPVQVAAPAAIPPRHSIRAVMRVTGPRRATMAILEQRVGRRWVRRARRHTTGRSFLLTWRAPAGRRPIRIRAVAVVAGRRIASRSHLVRILRSGSGARVVLPASGVIEAPAGGTPGTLRFHGLASVERGDIVATGVGPNTPTGFLGEASTVRHDGVDTLVETQPTTLMAAVPDGELDTSPRWRA